MSTPEPPPTPSLPRAFTRGSGAVFQVVGAILAFGSCCWWSFGGPAGGRLVTDGDPRSFAQVVRAADAPQIWAMAGVCAAFTGGMALAALGLGLQAERRGAAVAASWVAGLSAVFWIAHFLAALFSDQTIGRLLWTIIMALVWTACLVLALVSADELRRLPPPPDLGRAPPDLRPDRLVDSELPDDLKDMPR